MKGGPLQASLLLVFSGDVLGVAEAFDLSCAVFLFTIRATQVTATVDVLLAHVCHELAFFTFFSPYFS